jgi:hypothetical protein
MSAIDPNPMGQSNVHFALTMYFRTMKMGGGSTCLRTDVLPTADSPNEFKFKFN